MQCTDRTVGVDRNNRKRTDPFPRALNRSRHLRSSRSPTIRNGLALTSVDTGLSSRGIGSAAGAPLPSSGTGLSTDTARLPILAHPQPHPDPTPGEKPGVPPASQRSGDGDGGP
ncbi:hypothetical protein NL676_005498 [Syzygium grande]|nr:hypothetical protein NL676_005498 [Syzygium grande]